MNREKVEVYFPVWLFKFWLYWRSQRADRFPLVVPMPLLTNGEACYEELILNPFSVMKRLTLSFCAAGFLLHLFTVHYKAENGFSLFMAGLFFWSFSPYAVSIGLLLLVKKYAPAMGYAVASLCCDIFMFLSVFVSSTGSTSALGLLAMPLWNLLLFGPAGAFIAWQIYRAWLGTGKDKIKGS